MAVFVQALIHVVVYAVETAAAFDIPAPVEASAATVLLGALLFALPDNLRFNPSESP